MRFIHHTYHTTGTKKGPYSSEGTVDYVQAYDALSCNLSGRLQVITDRFAPRMSLEGIECRAHRQGETAGMQRSMDSLLSIRGAVVKT
jgi:hypothetical protein